MRLIVAGLAVWALCILAGCVVGLWQLWLAIVAVTAGHASGVQAFAVGAAVTAAAVSAVWVWRTRGAVGPGPEDVR